MPSLILYLFNLFFCWCFFSVKWNIILFNNQQSLIFLHPRIYNDVRFLIITTYTKNDYCSFQDLSSSFGRLSLVPHILELKLKENWKLMFVDSVLVFLTCTWLWNFQKIPRAIYLQSIMIFHIKCMGWTFLF